MRSSPPNYEIIAPGSLDAVLAQMSAEPGVWTPVAGGTEVMVQFGAGRLAAQRLVSIRGLRELCEITATDDELQIGAGSTYSDLRKHSIVATEFPLLGAAASWTGSIANQNRGTLGGNIVNASPAADSPPALLAYEADLILISARGRRRVSYAEFHTGYKKTLLAPDELILSVVLPRRYAEWTSYARKVGARNAQAISKICIAALARIDNGRMEEIHIAFGSMAPTPIRLREVEKILESQTITDDLISRSRRVLQESVSPIDDIRSMRTYRVAVACNLLEEFLRGLKSGNSVLSRWNLLSAAAASREILSCCGSSVWAREMAAARPFPDEEAALQYAAKLWRSLGEEDWAEAFRSHPRIGERHAERATTATSANWSSREQRLVSESDEEVKQAIATGNRAYEDRFGRIFIICAAGKRPAEILENIQRRLENNDADELVASAAQQEQIMLLRLRKWLHPEEQS